MDDNFFFKLVWRFNALAIAAAVTLGVVIWAYASYRMFGHEARERLAPKIVDVRRDSQLSENFTFAGPSNFPGTSLFRIPLYRGHPRDNDSFSTDGSGKKANFLFLNVTANESHWLLPTTEQIFLHDVVLYDAASPPPGQMRSAVAVIYAVIDDDSDKDGRLTSRDLIMLAGSSPDGKKYVKLTSGIDRMLTLQQIANDKALAIYEKDGATMSEIFSVPTFATISRQTLPTIGAK